MLDAEDQTINKPKNINVTANETLEIFLRNAWFNKTGYGYQLNRRRWRQSGPDIDENTVEKHVVDKDVVDAQDEKLQNEIIELEEEIQRYRPHRSAWNVGI